MDENTVQQKLPCVTNVKKRGHFQTVCRSRSKTVGTIGGDESSVFMGTIHGNVEAVNTSSDPWNVTLLLDGISVQFKMDTGADVTAIPSHIFDKLSMSDRLLKGPGQEILTVKGKFTTELKWQQKN